MFDTHCHLNDEKLMNQAPSIITKARFEGVHYFNVVGYDKPTITKALFLAQSHKPVFMTFGFHPTIAKDLTDRDFEWLEELIKYNDVIAVGECGLDYHWDKEHKKEQENVFRKQIDLALKYDLPVVIHMRDATEDTYNILKEYPELRGIMHCYSGSLEYVQKFIDLGFYISLAGPVTFKNAVTPKEVAKIVPFDRLLIETDSPYLAPHPHRGKTNTPIFLPLIAETIAELRGCSIAELVMQTTNNAFKIFKLGDEHR
jgi:TatD DNase family protein